MKPSFTIILFVSVLIIPSCLSVKPGGHKGAKKLYTSYYAGSGSSQYFIKPLAFETESGNYEMKIDFSFRYKNNLDSTVTINSTILGNRLFDDMTSVGISVKDTTHYFQRLQLLFKDKKGDDLLSRHTMTCSLKELNNWIQNPSWKIIVSYPEDQISFVPTTKTKKSLVKLREQLFVLF